MLKNPTQKLLKQLTQFRQALYDCFDARQDTVMDLLDANASNTERPHGVSEKRCGEKKM